jgi:hypothetical protein
MLSFRVWRVSNHPRLSFPHYCSSFPISVPKRKARTYASSRRAYFHTPKEKHSQIILNVNEYLILLALPPQTPLYLLPQSLPLSSQCVKQSSHRILATNSRAIRATYRIKYTAVVLLASISMRFLIRWSAYTTLATAVPSFGRL